jgi:hypothetical protein
VTKWFTGLASMIAVASCAPEPRAPGVTGASCTSEACLPAHEPLLRVGSRATASETEVRIEPKDGVWTVAELLDMISRTTGRPILYETSRARLEHMKMSICSVHVVRESELLEWLQAVLSFQKLAVVPVGPNSPGGSDQWLVVDQADPSRK